MLACAHLKKQWIGGVKAEGKREADSLFDPDGFNLDEPGGVSGLEATKFVHG